MRCQSCAKVRKAGDGGREYETTLLPGFCHDGVWQEGPSTELKAGIKWQCDECIKAMRTKPVPVPA